MTIEDEVRAIVDGLVDVYVQDARSDEDGRQIEITVAALMRLMEPPEPPETRAPLSQQITAIECAAEESLPGRRSVLLAALETLRWVQGLKGDASAA